MAQAILARLVTIFECAPVARTILARTVALLEMSARMARAILHGKARLTEVDSVQNTL